MPGLRREIGVASAALMVVGGIIGSGIFFTPAEVARALPDANWIFGVWLLGGLLALAGALTYAELGALLPDAGGPYVYIRKAFGALPAFLYGWMVMLSIAAGAIAAVSMGFAGYLGRFVDLAPLGGQLAVAALTIIVLTATNYIGLRPGIGLQNVLTGAKIVALTALIVGGLLSWQRLAGAPAVPATTAEPAPDLITGFARAFVAVLFTIGGWQQMTMVAGEIREPSKTIPRAMLAGIAVVIAIYLGTNAVYLRALERDGLAASNAVAADTMARIAGAGGATFITAAAMISILGFVNVAIISNSRLPYALARDGHFPRAIGDVHERFGTPHMAIAVTGAWSLILLLTSRGRIGDLLSGVVFADWIFFGLGAASVFVLRRTMADAQRPYRAWGYPLLPLLFVLAAAAGVVSAIVAAPAMSGAGVLMLASGVLVFRFHNRRSRV